MGTTTVTSRRLATLLRAELTKDGRAGRALLEWAEEHRSVFWPGPKPRAKETVRKLSWTRLGAMLGEMVDDPLPPHLVEAADNVARVLGFAETERDGGALLLFDEMEDLIGDAQPQGAAKRFANRAGSKIFVNRLLETNKVPIVWTSNAIDNVDSAYLRRMSFVLRLDHPRGDDRDRALARMASIEDRTLDPGLSALARQASETTSVARIAMRTARIAGADPGDDERVARSLLGGLRGQSLVTVEAPQPIDLSLFESDQPIDRLIERLVQPGAPTDVSVLLSGPPGTGKTQLAGEVAERLGRPLATRRASDLLSKWVGETEANIATAFRDAAADGAVLLFDEADSLLFDRQRAERSWEVTQVNELLTWLDRHPLPVFAATNDRARLDPAALRRFTFKLDLRALSAAAAARAFERFFGIGAPTGLDRLAGLTPGDFAVVARQVRVTGAVSATSLIERLEAELAVKPGGMATIGF